MLFTCITSLYRFMSETRKHGTKRCISRLIGALPRRWQKINCDFSSTKITRIKPWKWSTISFWSFGQETKNPTFGRNVNRAHMVNSEVKSEDITSQLMHKSSKHTRRAPLIGLKYFGGDLKFKLKIGDKIFNAWNTFCLLAFHLYVFPPYCPKSDFQILHTHYHFTFDALAFS